MKRYTLLSILLLLTSGLRAQQDQPISKDRFDIVAGRLKLSLMVGVDDRLYQLGFGDVGKEVSLPARFPSREKEFFPVYGNGVITESALQITHVDGNTSTDLSYVKHTIVKENENVSVTTIELKDQLYPVSVNIYIKSYHATDMMEIWNEISHNERGIITLYNYMSASPVMNTGRYWLTQFAGNYKREATLYEEQLLTGIKVLDSKLGIRAHQMRIPSFLLSSGSPAKENEGEVFGASLRWSGSFRFTFDTDWNNNLRVLTGINPLGGDYRLDRGEVFTTPAVLWTWADKGKGQISRNFHEWAKAYGIRDANKDRPVILNNWEATYCNFDEERLTSLFDGAAGIGAELFLLDDGWFGNGAYSRDDDKHGLGDWDVSVKKLPNGLSYLTREAGKRKIDFGIWLEPEMVNPKSELYNKHPDWVITQKGRDPILGRHQEILDLTRPEVQKFEWDIFEKTLRPNPDIRYVKWDCNRYITQPGSSYLPADRQSHLQIDYHRALYRMMDKFATEFPDVMAMVCAGGSGRIDYGCMPYFHSFWPSDNTDPLGRIKIQWGFSHFFPASTMSAHVTRMGKRHLKLAIDVALSGSFGIDLALDKATPEERRQLADGVKIYKTHIRPLIMQGDLYRLVSPYENPVASLSYVSKDKKTAALFIYQTEDGTISSIIPEGLDPQKQYRINEINLASGNNSKFDCHGKIITGSELMNRGIRSPLNEKFQSAVIYLKATN